MRSTSLASRTSAVRSLLLPLLLTSGAAAVTFAFGREEVLGQEAKSPKPCERWHRGAGETTPLDLAAVRKAYANLASKLDHSFAKARTELPDLLERPHRTTLPRCESRTSRTLKLKEEIGSRLSGAHFYFGWLGSPDRFLLPRAIAEDPEAFIHLLACERLTEAGELSRRLKRPVHLAAEDFARALGVRCAGSRVRVSANGEEVEIHEGE